jgi:hypothetical protein
MDWGIAFSITPSRVNWKTAVASPFVPTEILRESAVNAAAGTITRNAKQRRPHIIAGKRDRIGWILSFITYIPCVFLSY